MSKGKDKVLVPIPDRLYVLTEKYLGFITGDYFYGTDDRLLRHVRTGMAVVPDTYNSRLFFDTRRPYDRDLMARMDAEIERFIDTIKHIQPNKTNF